MLLVARAGSRRRWRRRCRAIYGHGLLNIGKSDWYGVEPHQGGRLREDHEGKVGVETYMIRDWVELEIYLFSATILVSSRGEKEPEELRYIYSLLPYSILRKWRSHKLRRHKCEQSYFCSLP
jgi:hypothetical protein